MLTSGLLLTVVGVAASGPMAPLARRSVVGAAVAVTAFGFAWQVQRTHVVADAGRVLAERTEDVLIAPNGFLSREFGAFYPKQDWLGSSRGAQDLEAMVGVAKQSGATSLGVVTTGESTLASALVRERSSRALTFDGWVSVGVSRIDFIGTSLLVHRFERTAA